MLEVMNTEGVEKSGSFPNVVETNEVSCVADTERSDDKTQPQSLQNGEIKDMLQFLFSATNSCKPNA
jgi:hypothetical protein